MCILFGVFVIFMTPGGREPEPEDEENAEREPASEPLTSRHAMSLQVKCLPFFLCLVLFVVFVCVVSGCGRALFCCPFVVAFRPVLDGTLTAHVGGASFLQCCLLEPSSLKRDDDAIQRVERPGESQEALDGKKSRYAMSDRSLGHVYADVFADPMSKVEGMLVWMYHRCEGRVHRRNKRVLYGFRMETLQQVVRVCYDYGGMTSAESQNMLDNVVAMTDFGR